jgi:Undecaprenyl-phosphate glucose phosphotransferase
MPSDSSYLDRGFAPPLTLSSSDVAPAAPSRTWSDADLEIRLPGLLYVIDWFAIALLGVTMDALFAAHGGVSLTHALAVVLGATAMVNFLHLAHAYSMHSIGRLPVQLTKIAIAWSAAFLGVMMIGVAAEHAHEFWGRWATVWFVAALLFLAAVRCAAARRLRRWRTEGRTIRNVAVLGTGVEAFALAQRLRDGADKAHVVGVFIDGHIPSAAGSIAGDAESLASLAGTGKIDEVVVALPWRSPGALNRTLSEFAASQVEVTIDPGLPPTDYPPTEFSLVAGIPTLKVQCRPLAGWGAPLKRLEDVVLASILIVALSPVLLLIALLVKIDSRGPVLFRQERYGINNQPIKILKFRSMHHDPDPDPSVPHALRNDPRVTRVGGFLRRTSLDELPQLLNVLRGEMSLVGPRPHAAVHNEKYARLIEGYLGRHRMKPGITGWAQVNGLRGGVDGVGEMRLRLEYDRYYMSNWSLLLDVKILLMTFPAVLRGTNAY